MGIGLSQEQHQAVLDGRAICNDHYWEYPEGCAVQCLWGAKKLALGYSAWQRAPVTQWSKGKITTPQVAVEEMMAKLGATELHSEYMQALYRLVDEGVCFSWRQRLLALRQQFAPRFFAYGIDVWMCSEQTGGQYGHREYWVLFCDRSVAPNNVKSMIGWRHLMWGMGTGLRQEDVAPIIQQYMQQLADSKQPSISTSKSGDDLLWAKGDDIPKSTPAADDDAPPPAYSEEELQQQL